MEKVLTVPQKDQIPQQTGYWCGPASCQTALQVIDIWVEEQALANEMGTTTSGTNHIGLLADAMSAHAPQGKWSAVWLENDPPTPAQKEQFWEHLKASIDAGFAVPANWVSPPGNHPVCVNPNTGLPTGINPGYSGTIYHYICLTGIAENEHGRFVHVSDSGFSVAGEWQYWVTLDQCATLMPPKGYVWASAAPVGVPTLPGPALDHSLAEKLAYAMDESLPLSRYEELLPSVLSCLEASECTNVERISQWFAQVGHESGGLMYMEELSDGSQYEGREDLGNTHPGDGPKYKGHGPIQITGFFNHEAVSEWAYGEGYVDSPTKFVDEPTLLASDDYGFMGTAWYWTVARGDQINAAADIQDHETVCRLINGGLNGFDDRKDRYYRAKEVAPAFLATLQNPSGPPPTEGDLLSALTDEEQREVLFLLRILADERFPSRSPLRHINEGPVDTVAGMTLNTDATTHILLVIRLAELGDTGAIDLLNEIAGCTDPERASDAKLAQRVLTALKVDHTVDATPYSPAPPPPPRPPARPWRV